MKLQSQGCIALILLTMYILPVYVLSRTQDKTLAVSLGKSTTKAQLEKIGSNYFQSSLPKITTRDGRNSFLDHIMIIMQTYLQQKWVRLHHKLAHLQHKLAHLQHVLAHKQHRCQHLQYSSIGTSTPERETAGIISTSRNMSTSTIDTRETFTTDMSPDSDKKTGQNYDLSNDTVSNLKLPSKQNTFFKIILRNLKVSKIATDIFNHKLNNDKFVATLNESSITSEDILPKDVSDLEYSHKLHYNITKNGYKKAISITQHPLPSKHEFVHVLKGDSPDVLKTQSSPPVLRNDVFQENIALKPLSNPWLNAMVAKRHPQSLSINNALMTLTDLVLDDSKQKMTKNRNNLRHYLYAQG